MTREEIAAGLDYAVEHLESYKQPYVAKDVRIAAAELRKTCATCQHFITTEGYRNGRETHPPIASCVSWRSPVPIDGSGFCHRWEAKP